MDDKSFNIRVPKRWARIAMIVGVTALIVAPLTAVATHTFDDVANTDTFHDDIDWLKDAAVTFGCNPPDNDLYCPDDSVTRGQMAAFMRRLAENRVVDAGSVGGIEAGGFVQQDEPDAVDASMTVDESGVASSHVDDFDDLTATVTSYASVTISAPADGFVLLNASTYINTAHVNGGGTDQPRVSISSSASAHDFNAFQLANIASNQLTATYRTPISLVAIHPVSAGDHTFHLVADVFSQSAVGANELARRTLTASFVPTAYGDVVANSLSEGGDPNTEEGR